MGTHRHVAAPAWTRPVGRKRRVVFIDIARALAAILVVYSHVDWLFFRTVHDRPPQLLHYLDRLVVYPLGLGDQGPGAIGVPMFFIASGFAITPIALKMTAGRFVVNRLLRVYPLLIVVVLVTWFTVSLGLSALTTGPVAEEMTFRTALGNIGLYTFFIPPITAFVGVAWTLVVELLFYALLTVIVPLMRRSVWIAIVVELDVILGIVLLREYLPGTVVAVCSYITMAIAGQSLWAIWAGRVRPLVGCALLAASWLLFFGGTRIIDAPDYKLAWYPFLLAVVVMVGGALVEKRLRPNRVWTALSDRCYSMYLWHGTAGIAVLALLFGHVPDLVAILAAIAAIAVVTELGYRFVEYPTHQWARRLSRPQPRPAPSENISPALSGQIARR